MYSLARNPILTSRIGWIATLVTLCAGGSRAAEFQINTSTTSTQYRPAVAADPTGEFMVVWTSSEAFPLTIKGQRFSSDGTAIGTEFLVSPSGGDQREPSIAAQGNANFVVVWREQQVFGRRISGGTQVGSAFLVSDSATVNKFHPRVAASPSGDFVVAWDLNQDDIFGRRFASDGTSLGSEFQVNSFTSGMQWVPAVAMDATGAFVVVWQTYDGSSFGIGAQRYSSAGDQLGTEFIVNVDTMYDQMFPGVRYSPNGEFVVVWGSLLDVVGRRFQSSGSPIGGDFQISSFSSMRERYPDIAFAPSSEFVVSWVRHPVGIPQGDIIMRRFTSEGAPIGEAFMVNTYTTHANRPAVTSNEMGDFVVVWQSNYQDGSQYGVFGQRFEGTAAPTPMSSTTTSATSSATTTPTPTATQPTAGATATATNTAIPLCAGGPFACKVSGVTKVIVKNNFVDERDKMKFKWIRGNATTSDEFGNPVVDTQYTVCVWDYVGGTPSLVMEMAALPAGNCAGRPCWRSIGNGKGFRYKDLGLLPHGLQQVVLKSGTEGKPRVFVKGRGAMLPDPPMPFQQDQRITVQVVNSIGNCWGADFVNTPSKNTEQSLVAKERP